MSHRKMTKHKVLRLHCSKKLNIKQQHYTQCFWSFPSNTIQIEITTWETPNFNQILCNLLRFCLFVLFCVIILLRHRDRQAKPSYKWSQSHTCHLVLVAFLGIFLCRSHRNTHILCHSFSLKIISTPSFIPY